jgi:hypothetical protein
MTYLSTAEVAEVGCGRELVPSGAAVGKSDPAWTEVPGLCSLTKGVAAVEAAVTDCADSLDKQDQKEWTKSAERQ